MGISNFLKWLVFSDDGVSEQSSYSGDSIRFGLDEQAMVSDFIHPDRPGRVWFQGSWWFAVSSQKTVLLPGTPTRVVGRSGLTLVVEPLFSIASTPSNPVHVA
jgi:membrane protein implicated in regulation of membrane protease activity